MIAECITLRAELSSHVLPRLKCAAPFARQGISPHGMGIMSLKQFILAVIGMSPRQVILAVIVGLLLAVLVLWLAPELVR